MKQIKINSELP